MKVCDNCGRINMDDEEFCIGCGETEFTVIIFPLEEKE